MLASWGAEVLDKRLAVSNLASPQMTELNRRLSLGMDELEILMRRSGNPRKSEMLDANPEQQLQELAREFRKGTLIPKELLVYTLQIFARVKGHYDAKDFSDEDFRIQYYASAEVKSGKELRPLPPCLLPFAETSFFLTGPSGMGRSTYLQRLTETLGGPLLVRGQHPAPLSVIVMPHLLVRYPVDGKLSTLYKDLRQTVLVALRDHRIEANALSQLIGRGGKYGGNAENIAIALCILMNVGLFILDGGSWQSVTKNTAKIFNFLLKLREFSGIPILVSGTSAFIRSANYMSSLNGPLFNGPSMHIDMMPPPTPPDDEETATSEKAKGLWTNYVHFLWKQGFIPAHCSMPTEFPKWLHELTLGNLRWLKQGFEAFHVAIITQPELLEKDALTKKRVDEIFATALMTQQSTINSLKQIQMGMSVGKGTSIHVFRNMDYLPLPAFDRPAVNDIVSFMFAERA